MSYHYHAIECPHCGEQQQRGCTLSNCTTATVGLEPFTSSDGFEAELARCPETGEVYYVDFGIRSLEAENVQAS